MSRDFLHRNPALYEKVFERSSEDVCRDVFDRHMGRVPDSILDVGCGTGRDLHLLSRDCRDSVGVDVVPTMIEYARAQYPDIAFQVADMRSLRLGRSFDAVLALGSGLNYMLTNADLEQAITTFRLHSRPGGLLLIEPFNTRSFVVNRRIPTEFIVSHDGFEATGRATYHWDATTQTLDRQRVWTFSDQRSPVRDSFRLRLLFSQELVYFLENRGFTVLEIFERQRSSLYARSLYVVARDSG